MMDSPLDGPVLLSVDPRGIATMTLNRPERGNAYDDAMLEGLIAGLATLAADAAVRAVVIRGAGRHFQAGADIGWLGRAAVADAHTSYVASYGTVQAMQRLNEFPRPTIAVVHGACFGGGCGLACCADVVLATPQAVFGITEVRVGVAATPISTHLVNAIGARQARRYAMTGERFGAEEACRIGLVHEVVAAEVLEARLEAVLGEILLGAPGAVSVTKASLLGANGMTLDARQMSMLAHEGSAQRSSSEGREGTQAFADKRRPRWAPGAR